MATRLDDLKLTEVSLVDTPANSGSRVLLFKAAAPPPAAPKEDPMDPTTKAPAVTQPDPAAELAKRDQELAELRKQLSEQTAKASEADALAKRVDEFMQRENERQAIEKARSLIPNFVGDDTTKAAIVKAVDGIDDAEIRTKALQALQGANAAYDGLKQPTGSSADDVVKGAGAQAQINHADIYKRANAPVGKEA